MDHGQKRNRCNHNKVKSRRRIIISGGGTGGHIFPAIAIANALKKLDPTTEILFVGALGRMEMERVPAAGYKIIGLNIQGIQRKSILKNLLFPFKLLGSIMKSISIIKDFKPDVVVGVGGYASGPLLYAASLKGIPYLIQEQNSFAGVTNKRLGKKARKICVAFDGMEQFFPADKLIKTGNPVRRESIDIKGKDAKAIEEFRLSPGKKTILVIGGSLGARTLNESVLASINQIIAADVQVIWQTGKHQGIRVFEPYGPGLCRS
jgi:UDP-N-acetylglucosamine--N-acetylmuramyl-(pentapeptide) pyrophosphoryl-undecaprenol N-acetylglucosamine transferase